MSEEKYTVDLKAPDVSAYRGNTGIDYVTTFDSGRPGPHVLVTAVTHGNELCGAIALDHAFRSGLRPVAGKLTFAFDNIEAYLSFDPEKPSVSRYLDEDFNRVWDEATLDGDRESRELRRARALRPVVDAADYLLDIHSMQHATAPLMMAGMTPKSVDLARRVGVPELIVRDGGHKAGRRMRDHGGFGDPASPKNALLVECGQHWERRSADVAIETMLRFLAVVGSIDPALAPKGKTVPQRVIEVTDAVTIATDKFRFIERFRGLEVIPKAGTVIAHDDEQPVRTPYDGCVLIMPSRRMMRGQTAVRLGRFNA
jgi:predicted deacylase